MRAREFTSKNNQQVDEFLPALGAAAGAVGRGVMAVGSTLARGASAVGGAVARGAQAVGQGVSNAASAVGQGIAGSGGGAAPGGIDPAVIAQQQLVQKQGLQNQIKAKEAELIALKQQVSKTI
jgi:hypothetical protein